MKEKLSMFILVVFLAACSSGSDESPEYWSSSYKPILMERAELEKSIIYQGPQDMVLPTKIYIKGNYLFVSEKFKGIHIIDNHDPAKPVKQGFIRIPGCVDMAVKDNVLYADNAVDLVAITLDTINWAELQVSKRIANIFPEIAPPDYDYIPSQFAKSNRPKNTIIVDWKKNNN